jgi:hypothetical protein
MMTYRSTQEGVTASAHCNARTALHEGADEGFASALIDERAATYGCSQRMVAMQRQRGRWYGRMQCRTASSTSRRLSLLHTSSSSPMRGTSRNTMRWLT